MKTCPYCAEEIKDEAVVCKHCGRSLTKSHSKSILIIIAILVIAACICANMLGPQGTMDILNLFTP
jgi:uncharacterized paraquat-inducible protein A